MAICRGQWTLTVLPEKSSQMGRESRSLPEVAEEFFLFRRESQETRSLELFLAWLTGSRACPHLGT